ncbi:hypothetical protein [Massilia aerilata]|uniref:DNA transfer protein n=1 Tax=Massilia aerilata TaxID=453817 RepID=A0ABW0S659_9BURK
MSTIQDKIAQAKAAGYSDAEIAGHLSASPEYADKIKAATTAGYKPEDIVGHLSGKPAASAAAAPAAAPGSTGGAGNFLAESAAGFGAGAGTGLGKLALGAQRLYGKLLTAVDDVMPGKPAPTLSNLVTGKKPTSSLSRIANWLTDDADAGKARLDAQNAPYKAASPIANGAGEIGGQIVATLPVGGLLPAAMRTAAGAKGVVGVLPRAGLAAGAGAAYGGVTGAASSNADTFGGMLADGAIGAGSGAVFGGISSPVGAGIAAVGRNMKQRLSGTAAAEFAQQKIAEALSRDANGSYFTSGAGNPLTQIAARFGKLGDEARLVDAGGKNTNQLLDTLATLPGRTKQAVSIAQRQRAASAGDRMRQAADDALGTQGQRLDSTVDSLIARRERDSAPLYNQLRQINVMPSANLADIIQNAEALGVTRVGREIATARQMPFTLDAARPAQWNMGDLDHVKQGIDHVLQSSKAIGKDGRLTPVGEAYVQLKNALVGEMDQVTTNPRTGVSLYRQAREAFSEPSKLIDAGEAGLKSINLDESSIQSMVKSMSPNELQAFRIGAYDGLREKLGNLGGRTNIQNMWQNQSMQEKLRAIFGTERAYRQFAAGVGREEQLKGLQSVGRGSQTAARLAGAEDLGMSAMSDVGSAVGAAKTGNLLSALASGKKAWSRVALPQTVRDQMGNMLLSRGGEGAQTLNSLAPLIQSINTRNMLLSNGVGVLGGEIGAGLTIPSVPAVQQLPRQ